MNLDNQLIGLRPPRIAFTLVCIALGVHVLRPLTFLPSLPVTAIAVGAVGFALMIRAWWLFKVNNTAICPTAASSSLVTHDVFALSRNPMYLGMIMMLAGLALFFGSLPFYAALVIYGLVLDRVFCPYEEQKLAGTYGEQYAAYRVRVRRWL